MTEMFKNSIKLTSFTLYKERVYIIAWVILLLLVAAVMLTAFQNQFTAEELQGLQVMKYNPAHIALQGPFFAVETFQVVHFYAVEMHLFTLIAVAIFNIFLVMQSTRGDEEKGRYEVLRSLPIGRLSAFHAVMITAIIVNALLTVSHGVLLSILSISGMTTLGAFIYGVSLGVTGIFFAATSAVISQFSHSTRAVTGYAFFVLIVSYLLRAVGDVTFRPLSLISPLGLPLRAEAFVSNQPWPFFVMLILAFILFGVAYFLNARRDIGQGLLPEKQGRDYASHFLRTPLGLAWRQNRNTLFSWAIVLLGFGAALGGILRDAEHFAGENGAFQMLMPGMHGRAASVACDQPASADFSAVELFTMFLNVGFSIVCIAPVLILVFKVLREEKEGRAEPILSRAISRSYYLTSYIVLAFIASLLMPFATTVGLWAVSSLMLETPLAFGSLIHSMMVYVPALWAMLGLSILFVGVFPKAVALCWAYFTYVFMLGFFGELLNIPRWAMMLSPFYHIPQMPLEDMRVLPLLALSAVSLVLTICGLAFYRRRDVTG
ncbi:MAG: hypothetical protein FWC92_04990 [Defluviitaleaceae bacterium]|nr:hypothetical protein [Defluviitaleaceae bacterium]